jgi:rhodanese-related sulfurtransferase
MAGPVDSIDVGTLAHALSAGEPSELANAVLLDVREPWEFETARIERSVNIPMSTLVARIDEVRALQPSPDTPMVVICHHGMRSMQCARYLAAQGVDSLINLTGGIDAWSTQIDPSVPAY